MREDCRAAVNGSSGCAEGIVSAVVAPDNKDRVLSGVAGERENMSWQHVLPEQNPH